MPPPEVADDQGSYVAWLADYLYAGEFPLPSRQADEKWSITGLASDYPPD